MDYKDFIDEWQSGDAPVEVATSGSTGIPKRILLDRSFMIESARRTNAFFGIDSDSHLHSCISPDFIGGKMMAVRALLAGCRLTWEIPSNRSLRGIGAASRISLLAVVPSQMVDILGRVEELPSIESIIIGGGAIDSRLRRRIVDSGLNAFETYGMTETSSHIALRKVDCETEWFTTLPGITVDLDDRGCLTIRFDGGQVVVTNDLATLFDPTRFRIDGRADNVIVTGGRKVNPFEVERRISDLIGTPFIVTSLPDEKWGRRVVLKIERGADIPDVAWLRNELSKILAPWERPKDILVVGELERTPNGKLKR